MAQNTQKPTSNPQSGQTSKVGQSGQQGSTRHGQPSNTSGNRDRDMNRGNAQSTKKSDISDEE